MSKSPPICYLCLRPIHGERVSTRDESDDTVYRHAICPEARK